jgi:hypothetical protein
MVRIDGGAGPPAVPRPSPKAPGQGRFAPELAPGLAPEFMADSADPATAAGPVLAAEMPMDLLMAMQSAPWPPAPSDERAHQNVRQLLAALRHLQLAMIGGDTASSLAALATALEENSVAVNENLSALLRATRLRARIEMLKNG